MQKILLSTLVVLSLGISACVLHPPQERRDGDDNRHEQRRDDSGHQQRRGDDDQRDQRHDGRN